MCVFVVSFCQLKVYKFELAVFVFNCFFKYIATDERLSVLAYVIFELIIFSESYFAPCVLKFTHKLSKVLHFTFGDYLCCFNDRSYSINRYLFLFIIIRISNAFLITIICLIDPQYSWNHPLLFFLFRFSQLLTCCRMYLSYSTICNTDARTLIESHLFINIISYLFSCGILSLLEFTFITWRLNNVGVFCCFLIVIYRDNGVFFYC